MMWTDSLARVMSPWEIYLGGYTIPAAFWVAVVMGLVPPLAYTVAYRFCLGLQRGDRAVLEHGIETGIVKRLPHGEYIEVHQSLGVAEYQGAPVPKKMSKLGAAGEPGAGGFLTADPAAEREALAAVRHHEERAQLMVLKAKQDNGSRG